MRKKRKDDDADKETQRKSKEVDVMDMDEKANIDDIKDENDDEGGRIMTMI